MNTGSKRRFSNVRLRFQFDVDNISNMFSKTIRNLRTSTKIGHLMHDLTTGHRHVGGAGHAIDDFGGNCGCLSVACIPETEPYPSFGHDSLRHGNDAFLYKDDCFIEQDDRYAREEALLPDGDDCLPDRSDRFRDEDNRYDGENDSLPRKDDRYVCGKDRYVPQKDRYIDGNDCYIGGRDR